MRVILLNDLRAKGKRGQEVEVKPGFARNYLLPQGLAVEASDANRKWFESQRKKIDARIAQEREEAQQAANVLGGARIEIHKRVGETGTLYGSVTASEIADALAAKGIQIDRRKLELGAGIKAIGDHRVNIQLHPEVTAELMVTVLPEG
jgi:large subunit ribosomal protein L9